MNKTDLREIKKGEFGTGLLIENDGYISLDSTDRNRLIKENFDNNTEWHIAKPFVVDAIFQKKDYYGPRLWLFLRKMREGLFHVLGTWIFVKCLKQDFN